MWVPSFQLGEVYRDTDTSGLTYTSIATSTETDFKRLGVGINGQAYKN